MSQHAPLLADRVQDRGPLAPDEAAALLLPVAESLASAHATGLVHGAVSPAVVRVRPDGGAVLSDPGHVVADPAFTAPEVAGGGHPDARADVWAFGGLLLNATTGRRPYSVAVRPRDGGWLRPITELALQPDPDDRPSMADVAAYLRAQVAPRLSAPEPGRTPAPPARDRRRGATGPALALVAAGVVVLLGLLGGALLLVGGDDSERAADTADRTVTPPAGPASPSARRTPEQPGPEAAPRPTARQLERFARTYVRTASEDPESGYARLTPAYQQASPRYREVWSAIGDPEMLAVSTDPGRMRVSYTYSYTLPDGTERTEDVTLRLVQRKGRLLIAGATARLR